VVIWNLGGLPVVDTQLAGAFVQGEVTFLPIGDDVELKWDLTLLR